MTDLIHYTFKCGWETTVTVDEAKKGKLHDRCPHCHPEQYKDLKFFSVPLTTQKGR